MARAVSTLPPPPPPIPQVENQRLRRPHLHSPRWLVPAAAMYPSSLEGWGSEPSAGAPYFPSPPPHHDPHSLPAFSCFTSLGL